MTSDANPPQPNDESETGRCDGDCSGAPSDDSTLRTAFKESGCGVFWLDERLRVRRANAAFSRFVGRSGEELIDAAITDLDPGWPHGSPEEAFKRLRATTSAGHATRLRRPDGTLWPVQVHLNFLSLGGMESLFGVAVDTADRQAAEDALRTSEARYRAVTEDQTEFIVRIRPDQIVTFCNPAYARLVDAGDPEHVVGMRVQDLVLEQDFGRISESMRQLTPENPVALNENLVPSFDGPPVWVSWVVRALFEPGDDGTPRVREYQSVGRDVTERRAVWEALSRTEARYRSLVEDSPELVSRWKPGGPLSFANRSYCEFFGLSSGPARDHDVLSPHDAETRAEVERSVAALSPADPLARMVIPARRADGAVRQLEWIERGFFDDDGRLVELQSVGRDITERLEAEARLADSERRHRTVLDDLAEMVNRFRPDDGLITYANRAFLEAKCDPGEHAVGRMTIFDHLTPDLAASAREKLAAVTPEQPSVSALLALPGPDGATRWEEWTNRALFAPSSLEDAKASPVVVEFQSVGRDVTVELAARGRRRERESAAALLEKLSPRERQVLRAVTTGVTNKVIAQRLGITERTVEKHRGAAMRKLGVSSAAELVRAAIAAEESDPPVPDQEDGLPSVDDLDSTIA